MWRDWIFPLLRTSALSPLVEVVPPASLPMSASADLPFTAPVVGQELTDALVAAEEIAKAERRAIAVAREKQLADLQAEL